MSDPGERRASDHLTTTNAGDPSVARSSTTTTSGNTSTSDSSSKCLDIRPNASNSDTSGSSNSATRFNGQPSSAAKTSPNEVFKVSDLPSKAASKETMPPERKAASHYPEEGMRRASTSPREQARPAGLPLGLDPNSRSPPEPEDHGEASRPRSSPVPESGIPGHGPPSSSSSSSSFSDRSSRQPLTPRSDDAPSDRSVRTTQGGPFEVDGIRATPYRWSDFTSNDSYDLRVNFQRMIIMMVLRKRDGGVLSPTAKRLLETRYFTKPWKKLGKRLRTLSDHLSRRSWDDLAERLRRESVIIQYPCISFDAISLHSRCEGCGHEHAACYSYSDCRLHGARYCPVTFNNLDSDIGPSMTFTLGHSLFRQFEEEHFGETIDRRIAEMLETTPIPIDRIVSHFEIRKQTEDYRQYVRTKLYLIDKRRERQIEKRRRELEEE